MKVGVCGIACEMCPRMVKGTCPHWKEGCTPQPNKFCAIATYAHVKGVKLCFECSESPCNTTKKTYQPRVLPVHFREGILRNSCKHLEPLAAADKKCNAKSS